MKNLRQQRIEGGLRLSGGGGLLRLDGFNLRDLLDERNLNLKRRQRNLKVLQPFRIKLLCAMSRSGNQSQQMWLRDLHKP